MTQLFNFSELKNIYSEAWTGKEHSLAFEVAIGRGRFVFMIFFSPEDKASSGEELYIHLRNVNSLMRLKLYGSRKNGAFNVYIRPDQEQMMIDELQLHRGGGHFTFENLLNELNDSIPQRLDFRDKLNTIRDVWPDVGEKLSSVVDDADKTILIGIKKLPQGYHPREKTLRKLFMFTNSRADDVSAFISSLKKENYTLMWTNNTDKVAKSLADLMLIIR
ncbi:hypothetical protein [Erwinia pyrifoliae]|uniref:hypothetical protein n=1 Tax=Erwinia pyrifoliae TaxID=79967 RepID=UPI00223BE2F5|nr:hypothetical protein [Erwinia pyrifoliae]MCT2387526.1 hypothetical protein [Erwinia pyrifoliae]MCU8585782.1 hypothetical protein [Erwinia pyrifoliae]